MSSAVVVVVFRSLTRRGEDGLGDWSAEESWGKLKWKMLGQFPAQELHRIASFSQSILPRWRAGEPAGLGRAERSGTDCCKIRR